MGAPARFDRRVDIELSVEHAATAVAIGMSIIALRRHVDQHGGGEYAFR